MEKVTKNKKIVDFLNKREDDLVPTKHVERVLKNYRNFQKLASLSDKPF